MSHGNFPGEDEVMEQQH